MSLAATQKVSSFGTPLAGAGVAAAPKPTAAASAPAASPAAIKEAIIERSAQAVVDNLKKIFSDEISEVGTAIKQNTALPGAIAYTYSYKTSEGTKSMAYGLRPEKLKNDHIVKVEGLSGAKLSCYSSILNRSFAKMVDDCYFALGVYVKDCEELTPETFTNSKLVRSFAFKVLSRVPEKAIALF
jgi:hypothetical protein